MDKELRRIAGRAVIRSFRTTLFQLGPDTTTQDLLLGAQTALWQLPADVRASWGPPDCWPAVIGALWDLFAATADAVETGLTRRALTELRNEMLAQQVVN